MPTAPVKLRRAAQAAAAVCLLLATGAGAALPAAATDDAPPSPPATRPAATPATVTGWVRDLADTDPDVRARARIDLMGLDRAGLETLRQVVAASRPLGPSQAAALQDVVNHVYLATEPREDRSDGEAGGGGPVRGPAGQGGAGGGPGEGGGGFLGVQPAPSGVEMAPAPGVRPDSSTSVGIAVAARVPGFCAYRMLQDGDVILRLTSDRAYEFRSPEEFRDTIARQPAGATVTLDVLRRGRLVRVPITLDRKPTWANQMLPNEGMGPRQRRAADYWDQAFAPLVEGHTS